MRQSSQPATQAGLACPELAQRSANRRPDLGLSHVRSSRPRLARVAPAQPARISGYRRLALSARPRPELSRSRRAHAAPPSRDFPDFQFLADGGLLPYLFDADRRQPTQPGQGHAEVIPLQLFAGTLSVAMIVLILWMIRRDRLPVSHAIWWLVVSGLIGLFGLVPGVLDKLARTVGVGYAPSLLFVLAILTLLIKVLMEDLEVSTNRRRLLRLAQKTAMLEEEVRNLRESVEKRR